MPRRTTGFSSLIGAPRRNAIFVARITWLQEVSVLVHELKVAVTSTHHTTLLLGCLLVQLGRTWFLLAHRIKASTAPTAKPIQNRWYFMAAARTVASAA